MGRNWYPDKDAFAPVLFAGAFIALVPVCLAAIILLLFLRLPIFGRRKRRNRPSLPARFAKSC